MKQVVKFEKNEPVNNAGGPGRVDVFSEFLTVWGSLEKNSGSRFLSMGEIGEDNRYVLTVWFQEELYNQLTLGLKYTKVVVDNRRFTIATWKKIEEERMQLQFVLNEQR